MKTSDTLFSLSRSNDYVEALTSVLRGKNLLIQSPRLISNSSGLYIFCQCKSPGLIDDISVRLFRFDYSKKEWVSIDMGDYGWIKQHYYLLAGTDYYDATIVDTDLYVLIHEDGDWSICRFCIQNDALQSVQYMNSIVNGHQLQKVIGKNNEVHGFSFDENHTMYHALCQSNSTFKIIKELPMAKIHSYETFINVKTIKSSEDELLFLRIGHEVIEVMGYNSKTNKWSVSVVDRSDNEQCRPVSFTAGCLLKGGIILWLDNRAGCIFFIEPRRHCYVIRKCSWTIPLASDGATFYHVDIVSNHNKDNMAVCGFIRPTINKINRITSSYYISQIVSNYYSDEYIHIIIDAYESGQRYNKYYLKSWFYCVDELFL